MGMGTKATVLIAVWGLCMASCIGAGDQRCSPGEDFDEGFCLCEPPRMLDEDGQCIESDSGAGGGDAPLEGFGDACTSDDDCTAEYNAHCAEAPAGDRYCTHAACDDNGQCPEGSYCLRAGEETFCQRNPTGLGMSCESDADCADGDAQLCTVGVPGGATCALEGCSEDADCPTGTVCNDFTDIVPDAPVFCAESVL